MDPERQAQAEAWENYIGLSHDLLHFDSAKKKKKRSHVLSVFCNARNYLVYVWPQALH